SRGSRCWRPMKLGSRRFGLKSYSKLWLKKAQCGLERMRGLRKLRQLSRRAHRSAHQEALQGRRAVHQAEPPAPYGRRRPRPACKESIQAIDQPERERIFAL